MINKRFMILILLIFLISPIFLIRDSLELETDKVNIILIHKQDDNQTLYYWNNFFQKYEYNLTLMRFEQVIFQPNLLKDFDLIILDNSTNDINGDSFSLGDAELLAQQGIPIITNGYAGWLILKLAGFEQFSLYDKTSKITILPEDWNLSLYHTPYEIEIENLSSFYLINLTDGFYNSTFFLRSNTPNIEIYSYRFSDCALGQFYGFETNPNIFFSFINSPSILSENGEFLYVNFVEFILTTVINQNETLKTSTKINIISYQINENPLNLEFRANLTEIQNNPITNQNIKCYFNSYLIFNLTTDQNGEVFFQIAILDNINIVSISLIYEGNDQFERTEISFSIEIKNKEEINNNLVFGIIIISALSGITAFLINKIKK